MKLPTLASIDKSLGGRPKIAENKVRLSFYLGEAEAIRLRAEAKKADISVSRLVRGTLQPIIKQ